MAAIAASLAAFGAARNEKSTAGGQAGSRLWFALALLAFLCLGMVMFLATIPSHWKDWSDVGGVRIPIYYAGVAGVYAAILIRRPGRMSWTMLALAALICIDGLASLLLIFGGLDRLGDCRMVSIAYPIAVGTCIVGFAAYSLFILRERTTPLHIAGIALAVAGIALAAL